MKKLYCFTTIKKEEELKQIILLFILSANIVLNASDRKEALCENGDAIACYELGTKISYAPMNCRANNSRKLMRLLNPAPNVVVTQKEIADAEEERKRLDKQCPKSQPDKVKSLYKKACQYGYAYGCRDLDKKFSEDEIILLKKKCDKKDAKSCEKLGLIYYSKSLGGLLTMVTNDTLLEKSEGYYSKSCNYGYGKGCYFLATALNERRFNIKSKNSDIDIIESYDKACKLGYSMGCSKLGEIYNGINKQSIYQFNIEVNKTKAITYQKKACDSGSVKDCSSLAFKFKKTDTSVFGFSDDLTDPIARKYRAKACELGDASSCNNLANIYDNGLGVKQDYFKAVTYYKKACKNDMKISCTNLGIKYYNGQGVRQDYTKAKEYFEDACYKGELNACNNLGLMYSNGIGAKQDYFKAKTFFEKACNPPANPPFNISSSLGQACINLGMAYRKGLGVKQSLKKAKDYFGKACDNGLQSGCREYAKINRLRD